MTNYETDTPDAMESELCAEQGVEIIESGRKFSVKSSSGNGTYTVEFRRGGWYCDCPARKTCKHVVTVKRISDTVCDEFGLGDY